MHVYVVQNKHIVRICWQQCIRGEHGQQFSRYVLHQQWICIVYIKHGLKLYYILCRFAGSSVLEEDRASRRLEVDDQGLPRQASTDIWSTTSSRAPSRAASTTPSRPVSRYEEKYVVMQRVLHMPTGSRCSVTQQGSHMPNNDSAHMLQQLLDEAH